MTEHKRNRQQWKALRAPVIQRLWNTRRALIITVSEMLLFDAGNERWAHVYEPARKGLCEFWDRDGNNLRFGEDLNLLTAMRAAEKAGENALMWKLANGDKL